MSPPSGACSMLSIVAPAILTLMLASPSYGTISVISDTTNKTVAVIRDQPARFMPDQDAFYDLEGYLQYDLSNENACTPVSPPPISYRRWILLAKRGDCDFQTKIENAQNASYYAIIVHNVNSNSTEAMGVEDPSRINIFAVFVGEYDGHLLRDNFVYTKGYHIRIQDDFSFSGYLLPFAIVVGACFIVMLLFMLWQQIIRWIRERRRNRKRRLPASALKKLPTQKWTKGDPYETCAICIEDFVLHDKIRVLPCSHGFHTECIDPWLTKGRRVCPICKRKVVLAEERFSDSESDSDSETAPLLGASTSAAPTANSGSTFVQQRENPFRRAQRRMRTRPHQRPVVMPDTDSSSDSDDREYDSSSDPSRTVESSGSHASIVAEVHIPSHTTGPYPHRLHASELGWPSSGRQQLPQQEQEPSQALLVPVAQSEELDTDSREFQEETRTLDSDSRLEPIGAEAESSHVEQSLCTPADSVVVKMTASSNPQDFSDEMPESTSSSSASSASPSNSAGVDRKGGKVLSPPKPGNNNVIV